MKSKELCVTLEMNLNMLELAGEYVPNLKAAHIKIAGPKDSKDAADYMHNNLNEMLPFLFAEYFMNRIESENNIKVIVPISAACKMVLDYIESRSDGDK